ncbi:MAG: hypothetical protein IIX14_08620 [Clostridia bacterium]|nr:hypothetical protein [Clostridia bacterium]
MEFKAFSFEQNSHSLAQVKRAVADMIDNTTVYFESYSDSKALFGEIGAALEYADVVLIGIEPKAYLKFKPVLIKAFDFTPAYSDKIMDSLEGSVSDETVRKAHALIPDESEELMTKDGLYSGFFVNEENQYIVVFPLLESAVPEILMVPQLPFFKQAENKKELFSEIADKNGASPKAETIVEKLLKNDFRIAIPSTPASKLLKADMKACENYSDFVFFTPFVNDTGITDPKQYAAQLAKGAMELRSTELGATISNIFREKKGDKIISYYAFVSVATADKVVVKKLFAEADENIDNLLVEATAELYAMIDKYIDEVAFKAAASAEDSDKYEDSVIEAEVVSDVRPEASVSKAGIIIAIIAVIMAVVACVVLAFKFGDYFVKPSDPAANESYQQGETVQQTAPQTLPVIPAITEPDQTVAELTGPQESDTSIFGVTTTLPIPDTTYQIIYTPNPNNNNNNNNPTTTKPPVTQKPTQAPTETEAMDGVEW